MKQLIFPVLLCISASLFAQQELQFDNGCNFFSDKTAGTYTLFEATDEASKVVDQILNQSGITSRPFTLQVADVDNAQAAIRQRQRYLLYSNTFIKGFSKDAKTNWAAYCVFAHEIGHHVLGHNLDETDPKIRRQMELSADEFAAVAMARAGATEDDALSGIRLLKPETNPSFYPSVSAREEVMSIAFGKEQDRLIKEAGGKEGGARTYIALDDDSYNRWNIVEKEKVSTEITDEKVVVNFNIPPDYAYRQLNIVLCSTDPAIQIATTTGAGLTTFNTPGAASVTWNYQLDRVPRALASQPGKLRLFVYDLGRLPRTKVGNGSKFGSIGMAVAGAALVGTGFSQRQKAVDLNNIYKSQLNELDPVYADESRDDLHDRANKKYVESQIIMTGGGLLVAGSIIWWWQSHKKAKEARRAICAAERPGRFLWEPVLASENTVMALGARIKF